MLFQWLEPGEHQAWNRFVRSSPSGSVFCDTFYLDAAGIDYRIATVRKGAELHGGFVLTKGFFGLNATPIWAKYQGPVLRRMEGGPARVMTNTKQILDTLAQELRKLSSFDYNFSADCAYFLPFHWAGFRCEGRATYRFPEIPNPETLLSNAEARVGRNVRKAKKNGLQFVSELPLEELYAMQQQTYGRQKTKPPESRDAFLRTAGRLAEAGFLKSTGVVDADGVVHAACGVVHDENCGFLLISGMNYAVPDKGGNTYAIYCTLQEMAKHTRSFDFEGSMIQPIEHFYRGFGAEFSPYFRVSRPTPRTLALRGAVAAGKRILGYKR